MSADMDLLLLGGTRFMGRFLAELAVSRGHRVTRFHRGQAIHRHCHFVTTLH